MRVYLGRRLQAGLMLPRHWDEMRKEYTAFVDRWCALRNQVCSPAMPSAGCYLVQGPRLRQCFAL